MESVRSGQAAKRAALRQSFEELVQGGDSKLYYVAGEQFYNNADDSYVDPTVGGTHPSGMYISLCVYIWDVCGGDVCTCRPRDALECGGAP